MNNLNLLPPEIKNEINYTKKNARIMRRLYLILSLLIILIGFFVALFYIIQKEQSLATVEKESLIKLIKSSNNIVDESHNLASRINLIGKLDKSRINWSDILNEIAINTPSNIQLEAIEIDSSPKIRSKITGVAASDKDVVLFKNLLSNSKIFNYIDIESITEGSDPTGNNRPTKVFVLTLSLTNTGSTK